MTGGPVVSDASPLIAFAQIDQLDILARLFTEVLIPPTVAKEIAPSVVRPAWLVEREPTRPLAPRVVAAALDPGETEAIGLALELGARFVLLDDRRGRHVATGLGLPVTGALGVLRLAKRRGVVVAIRPHVEQLAAVEFRMSPSLQAHVLADAGEEV